MVRYKKGHKNSKGESAPWTIVSHETGKILSSHKTKAKAEEHLRQMEYYKHINESAFSEYLDTLPEGILFESIRKGYSVLFEASESDAYRYFEKEINTLDPQIIERLQQDIRYMLEDTHTEVDPSISWVRILFKQFQVDFGIKNTEAIYFIPGMARIIFRQLNKFGYEPHTALTSKAQKFRDIIKYIAIGHKGEYTRYLVDKQTGEQQTFESLKGKYGAALSKAHSQKLEDLSKIEYTPNDYQVIELTDFETANKFSQYATAQEWCHLASEDMFNFYRQDGYVRLYIAVKPGFEKLKPGDKGYGASMLGIDVGPKNILIHCNNRYNHQDDPELDNSKNVPGDDRYNMTELSKMLGGPFYEFCPYYTHEQMKEMGIIDFNEVEEKIAEGVPPEKFGKVVTCNSGKIDQFGRQEQIHIPDGYKLLTIPINTQYFPNKAIISPDNKIVGDQWFENIELFGNSVAIKTYDDEGDAKWIPMTLSTGEMQEDLAFETINTRLRNGVIVSRTRENTGNNEYNIYGYDTGTMLLDNWVDIIEKSHDLSHILIVPKSLFARMDVYIYNSAYVIDANLNPVDNLNFDCILYVDRFGSDNDCYITCSRKPDSTGTKYNVLSHDFDRLLFEHNYDSIKPGLEQQLILYTKECTGPDEINSRWYIGRMDGTVLSPEEYTGSIKPYINDKYYRCKNASGVFVVDSNGECKYSHTTTQDKKGKPLDFLGYERLSREFLIVKSATTVGDGDYDPVYNLYDTREQKLVFDQWYENAYTPGNHHRLFALYNSASDNVLFDAVEGKVLIENALVRHVANGYCFVKKDGLTNFLRDQDCKWLFDKWLPITFIEERSWPITGIMEYQGKQNIFSIGRINGQLALASKTGFDSVEYDDDTHEYIATENGNQTILSKRRGNMPDA